MPNFWTYDSLIKDECRLKKLIRLWKQEQLLWNKSIKFENGFKQRRAEKRKAYKRIIAQLDCDATPESLETLFNALFTRYRIALAKRLKQISHDWWPFERLDQFLRTVTMTDSFLKSNNISKTVAVGKKSKPASKSPARDSEPSASANLSEKDSEKKASDLKKLIEQALRQKSQPSQARELGLSLISSICSIMDGNAQASATESKPLPTAPTEQPSAPLAHQLNQQAALLASQSNFIVPSQQSSLMLMPQQQPCANYPGMVQQHYQQANRQGLQPNFAYQNLFANQAIMANAMFSPYQFTNLDDAYFNHPGLTMANAFQLPQQSIVSHPATSTNVPGVVNDVYINQSSSLQTSPGGSLTIASINSQEYVETESKFQEPNIDVLNISFNEDFLVCK